MRRGILAAFLILWQPGSAHLSQEKALSGWKTEADFKVRLWQELSLGSKEPQIAIMQLSAERQKELECDPLAFYKKYNIFARVARLNSSVRSALTSLLLSQQCRRIDQHTCIVTRFARKVTTKLGLRRKTNNSGERPDSHRRSKRITTGH